MRKFKFDVILWDGSDSETIQHFTIIEAIAEGFIDFSDGVMEGNDSSVIIREYINLPDKERKEICEGDILEFDNGQIRTVFAVEGGFAIEALDTDVGLYKELLCCPLISLSDEQNADYVKSSSKIIGNVFDNKDIIIKLQSKKNTIKF